MHGVLSTLAQSASFFLSLGDDRERMALALGDRFREREKLNEKVKDKGSGGGRRRARGNREHGSLNYFSPLDIDIHLCRP